MASAAEAADQKAVRHTLNCLKSDFKHTEVHSIDTDVLIQLLANDADEVPFVLSIGHEAKNIFKVCDT